MRVHIQGMGVVGCMLAWGLFQKKIRFTWDDKRSAVNAWKASTGCIYPCGGEDEDKAYRLWAGWHHNPPWSSRIALVEKAAYWFITKNPPHGGRYDILNHIGPLHNNPNYPSFHLNVQQFVKFTRKFFGGRESERPDDSRLIVSHGYHRITFDHYQWGWSAEAKLKISDELLEMNKWERPCFYLRRGRVTPLVYAMPKPGTDSWYAGSYMLNVKEPKSYDIDSKVEKWAENIKKLTKGLVTVKDVSLFREGWRPCGRKGLKLLTMSPQSNSTIFVRPMEGSGVRMAPIYVQAILEELTRREYKRARTG